MEEKGELELNTWEGFWGPRKSLSTLAVYPYPILGTHRVGCSPPWKVLDGKNDCKRDGGFRGRTRGHGWPGEAYTGLALLHALPPCS